MSLINKMLIDLEERQAGLAGEKDLALQGINSVNDPTFHRQTGHNRRSVLLGITVLVMLVLLSNITYQFLNTDKQETIFDGDLGNRLKEPANTVAKKPASPVISQATANKKSPTTPKPTQTAIDTQGFSLKLDTIMTTPPVEETSETQSAPVIKPVVVNQLPISRSDTPPELSISGLTLLSDHNRTIFRVTLTARPDYAVYALPSPDRVVVEINNIQNKVAIPRVEHTDLVRAVRARYQGKRRALIVLDMFNRSSVQGSEVLETATGHELVVTAISHIQIEDAAVPMLSDEELDTQLQKYGLTESGAQENKQAVDRSRMVKRTRTAADYYNDGLQAYRIGDSPEAASLFLEALSIDPRHTDARSTLISLMMEEGNRYKAAELLREGLKIYPAQYEWAKTRAHIFVEQGKLDAAIITLQKQPPALSEDLEYHALLAALLQQQGNHEIAVELYRKLLDRKMKNGVWWMGLGISLQALAKTRDADYAYRKALRDPALTPDLRNYIAGQLSQL